MKIPIVDRKSGEIREVEIFVAVLGASSYTFAEATKRSPTGLARMSGCFGFSRALPDS
ncbi:hypothetical protein NKI38_29520 [Mesorhizobium sp. M0621]|uniref:hypothetical protein n=1 Tax=Mesorhizobium sp. M0621 TaxID=2956974 RepID=UPI00333AFF07